MLAYIPYMDPMGYGDNPRVSPISQPGLVIPNAPWC
jgi:hypothetical protein